MPDQTPSQCVLIFALPPIRPDINSAGHILARGAVLGLADELKRHAKNPNVKAIRLSVDGGGGINVQIASHRPPV